MNANDIYEAFRKAMVETFVPEIKQLRESIEQLREEMREQNAQLREEMRQQNAQLREEMHQQNAQLREEMHQQNAQLREEMKEIKGALNVILHRLDVADRVAKLEGQVDFLLKKAS